MNNIGNIRIIDSILTRAFLKAIFVMFKSVKKLKNFSKYGRRITTIYFINH
nr:hypothetical protein HPHPH23_0397 [Helicobacter pylori Hp H-23]